MQRRRVSLVAILIVLGFGGLAARLVWLQGIEWSHWQERELRQRQRLELLPARRGRLLARDGELLAADVPAHTIVYTLTELEQCRRVSERMARLFARWRRPTGIPHSADDLWDSLQQLRHGVHGTLGGPYPPAPHPWIRDLDADLSRYLSAHLNRRPSRYPGLSVEVATGTVWVEPEALFAGEVAVRRVEAWLGWPVGELHDGKKGVWSQYIDARLDFLLARDGAGRERAQQRFDRERVLVPAEGVPFELAVDVATHPDHFPGLSVREIHRRDYPQGPVLCHVVGFTSGVWEDETGDLQNAVSLGEFTRSVRAHFDPRWFRVERQLTTVKTSDLLVGRSGMERRNDALLRGRIGARFRVVDGRSSRRVDRIETVAPIPGRDIRLTVDLELCREIREILIQHEVAAGSVLVANPRSGEILAWVSHPGFDPQTRKPDPLSEGLRPLHDRPRMFVLPPGSTIKPALALVALDMGVIGPTTEYTCHGVFMARYPHRWRCNNHNSLRPLTLAVEEALARSCNCFFYDLARRKLGAERFRSGLESLGFPPGTAQRPRLPNTDAQCTNAAIGQGRMLARPLDLLRFLAILVSGGQCREPFLCAELPPRWHDLDLDPRAVSIVLRGMRRAVADPGGTGNARRFGLRFFDCAVKTGTADQRTKVEATGEIHESNIAWLIGLAPSRAPELIFVVEIENTLYHGGEGAGPIVADILAWLETHRDYALCPRGEAPR